MSSETGQFYIEYTVNGESGRHTVIGRCGRLSIRVDDVFTTSFREAEGVDVADELGVPRGRLDETRVELRVTEIQAYGQALSEIGGGMTGSLALVGSGAAAAAPGRVLGDVVPGASVAKKPLTPGRDVDRPPRDHHPVSSPD